MLECWSEVLVAQSGRQVSEDIDDRVMHELILMQGCAPGEPTLFQKYKYTKKKKRKKDTFGFIIPYSYEYYICIYKPY